MSNSMIYRAIRKLAARKREKWHTQRADLFIKLMRPRNGVSILDLGGSDGSFMTRLTNRIKADICVADIGEQPLFAQQQYGFRGVVLEEGKPLPFADKQFDIVFCNSVIEHVTLPKIDCQTKFFNERDWISESMRSQLAFADEIRRVGSGYFVQTPHRSFPLEAHTWLPFVGWLSHNTTVRIVRISDQYWVKRCGYVDWRLLYETTMRELFPDAASLYVERFLGMPKSLVAYKTMALS